MRSSKCPLNKFTPVLFVKAPSCIYIKTRGREKFSLHVTDVSIIIKTTFLSGVYSEYYFGSCNRKWEYTVRFSLRRKIPATAVSQLFQDVGAFLHIVTHIEFYLCITIKTHMYTLYILF